MEKENLSKYNNPEDKLILSKILDKIKFCETRNQIQITDFLDLYQQELVKKFMKEQKQTNYLLFGGYGDSERKVLIVYPKKIENLIKEEKTNFNEWIKVLRLTLPNEDKGKYGHRNYLGALIKLGIKREKIGDIIVEEDGCDIILRKDILKFLESNLLNLTRFQKAKLEEIEYENLRKIEIQKEQIKITVSSMRLDNIVAELVNCSRNNALEILKQEKVFVNFQKITKPTKEIKENDRITIRGKGRSQIKQVIGNTKKGRIIVLVEKTK